MLNHSSPTHTTRPPQKPQLIPLSHLAPSSEGTVANIAEGPHRTGYMELGFVPGAHVVIIRAVDPALVSLDGSKHRAFPTMPRKHPGCTRRESVDVATTTNLAQLKHSMLNCHP